ncbi:sporulation protein YunB [Serpentinicella sp. ANB-PHB4]|uniref:sporulation protein YunB n=1 Tax=Serpentinicella sp. ANB-PHB4 TaxID=3074076 RepID=UPI00285AEB70|nr:sporulation protein YunB [Serpentinicella sp. ANB-PHB4]MDR5660081.1 sporulation protein YunB [Serpentinicella sp. ANB-PHB4]
MYKKRKYIKQKVMLLIAIILILVLGTIVYVDENIAPTVQALGDLKAHEITNKVVNSSVSDVLERGLAYNDLISTTHDEEGNITMMQANTILMNRIASDVALTIQEQLDEVKASSKHIPLGSALGSQLLAKYGPKLNLGISPIGVVDVNFASEFDQSGINQTRHRIYLTINSEVQVIVPFSSNRVNIATHVPLVETVIVGKVPQNYIQVPEDKFLNITPLYE